MGSIPGRAQVPALPGVGREVVQNEVPQRPVEVLSCGEEDSVRALATGCQASRPQTQTTCHLLTSENSQQPGWGDRKAPAAPIRAEKAGSPALIARCHSASPLVLPKCRSQARPRKPGSQRHGPRGWGKGTHRQGQTDRQGTETRARVGQAEQKVRRKEMSTKGEDGKTERQGERQERDRAADRGKTDTETQPEGGREVERSQTSGERKRKKTRKEKQGQTDRQVEKKRQW